MTHSKLEAVNTATDQSDVVPKKGTGAKIEDSMLKVGLPLFSYQMLRLEV